MSQREVGICPQTEDACNFREGIKDCPNLDPVYCRDFAIISGSANLPLVQEIAQILKTSIPSATKMFADGETDVKIPNSVRGKNVYIIQSGQPDPNTRKTETEFMVDAADRASAKEITVIYTYFPYSRKDRKDEPRVPIGAGVVAGNLKDCGMKRIVTFDLHAEQEQGFVRGPWDNLYTSYVLIPELKKYVDDNVVVASPDAGGVRRANFYAEMLGSHDIAVAPKIRDPKNGNEAKSIGILGNVNGKNILLVDDIIDSAGTLAKAAVNLKASGAKSIIVAAPHGLFSGKALENITNSPIDLVFTTNSIEQRPRSIRKSKNKGSFYCSVNSKCNLQNSV